MSGAAPAYRLDYSERAPRRSKPDVRVVRGRGVHATPLDPKYFVAAKAVLAIALAFALIGCLRVAFTAATVTSTMAQDTLSSQISEVRSANNGLEVKQTSLSDTNYVKKQAEALGMGEAAETTVVILPEDVVATDDNGDISLSKSLAIAASQAS